jgi:pilus assembly protein CpaF
LADGSRACIVLPPLAVDGPYVTIRRFVLVEAGLDDFAPPPVAEVLVDAVRRRLNLVVSGGTGSGKTTLLNALAAHVGPDERLVTIEDTAELRLRHHHVVRLQARVANSEGVGEVPIRQLVRAALRLRPDRILVGEARGAEVVDMLQAMNTGHEGSMSTCHANSPRDALRRLEALALLGDSALPAGFVRDQLTSALRLVVHVVRTDDGRRRVRDVVAVGPSADWRTGAGLEVVVGDGRLPEPPGVRP